MWLASSMRNVRHRTRKRQIFKRREEGLAEESREGGDGLKGAEVS